MTQPRIYEDGFPSPEQLREACDPAHGMDDLVKALEECGRKRQLPTSQQCYLHAVKMVRDTFLVIDRKLERRASACHKHNQQAADVYNHARRVLRGEP